VNERCNLPLTAPRAAKAECLASPFPAYRRRQPFPSLLASSLRNLEPSSHAAAFPASLRSPAEPAAPLLLFLPCSRQPFSSPHAAPTQRLLRVRHLAAGLPRDAGELEQLRHCIHAMRRGLLCCADELSSQATAARTSPRRARLRRDDILPPSPSRCCAPLCPRRRPATAASSQGPRLRRLLWTPTPAGPALSTTTHH